MKIYRCVIGSLLVLFIAIGIWYVASCYNEQRSIEDGVLVLEQKNENEEDQGLKVNIRRANQNGTDCNLYQS